MVDFGAALGLCPHSRAVVSGQQQHVASSALLLACADKLVRCDNFSRILPIVCSGRSRLCWYFIPNILHATSHDSSLLHRTLHTFHLPDSRSFRRRRHRPVGCIFQVIRLPNSQRTVNLPMYPALIRSLSPPLAPLSDAPSLHLSFPLFILVVSAQQFVL